MEALGYLSLFADFTPPNLQIERMRGKEHLKSKCSLKM